jgi:phosphatidylglycerophosphatase A
MIISRFFLSVGGVGFLPLMPGTFGSLVGLLFCFLPLWVRIISFALILFLSVILIDLLVKTGHIKESDPRWIVIDEVLGQMIPFLWAEEFSLTFIVLAFALFRFFDISKIFPIKEIEKYGEKNKKYWSWGIIGDDLAAGLFASIILWWIF